MSKNIFRKYAFVFLIIIFGLFLRLYNIAQPPFEFFPERQTQTAEITRNIYVNGWKDFWIPKITYEKGYPTPLVYETPIYNLAVSALYKIFGPSFVLGRIVSLFFFLMSSIFFVLIIRKYSTKKILIPSLLIFVFSPLHVLVSRSFQPDEMALALLMASLYFPSFFLLSLSGLIKLPFYLFGVIEIFREKNYKVEFIKYLAFFMPILLWSLRASFIMKHSGFGEGYLIFNWFNPLFFLDPRFYVSTFNIFHINVLTTLGLLFFIIGLFKTWGENNMYIWKKWLYISLLYVAVFNKHISTHEYYSLPLIPPLAAFAGAGIVTLINSVSLNNSIKKWGFSVIIGFLLFFALIIPSINKIANIDISKINPVLIERYYDSIDFK